MDKKRISRILHIRIDDFPFTAHANKLLADVNPFYLMLTTDHAYYAIRLLFHCLTYLSSLRITSLYPSSVSIYYGSKTTEINYSDQIESNTEVSRMDYILL